MVSTGIVVYLDTIIIIQKILLRSEKKCTQNINLFTFPRIMDFFVCVKINFPFLLHFIMNFCRQSNMLRQKKMESQNPEVVEKLPTPGKGEEERERKRGKPNPTIFTLMFKLRPLGWLLRPSSFLNMTHPPGLDLLGSHQ